MPPKYRLEERLFPKPKIHTKLSRVPTRAKHSSFDVALLELPQLIDWLALATTNGVSIFQGLKLIGDRAEGEIAKEIRKLCREIECGTSFDQALDSLARETKSRAVREFCNRLGLTLRRGTPLAAQLRSMAESNRAQLRNQLLARAGANEIKLLLPLVFVILPVTVWFAVFPSLQLLQLGL